MMSTRACGDCGVFINIGWRRDIPPNRKVYCPDCFDAKERVESHFAIAPRMDHIVVEVSSDNVYGPYAEAEAHRVAKSLNDRYAMPSTHEQYVVREFKRHSPLLQ